MTIQQLQYIWKWLGGLSISLLIHLALYIASPEVGNSTSFRLLAIGVAVFCIGILSVAWWLTEARRQRWCQRVKRLKWVFISVVHLALLALGFLARPEWLYAHLILTVGMAALAMYWTFYESTEAQPATGRTSTYGMIFVGLFGLCILALRLYSLSYVPSLDVNDEPWIMSWIVSYQRYGDFQNTIMVVEHPIYRYYTLVAAWFDGVGVGLYQGRSFSLLLVILQSAIVGSVAGRFYDHRAAGVYAFLLMMASNIMLLGLRLRHDVALGLSVALCLWFYSWTLRDHARWYWHWLAGLAIGLGAFGHYHASGFGVALTIGLYAPSILTHWRKDRRLRWDVVWFILGGLVGFAFVVVFQILPTDTGTNPLRPRTAQDVVTILEALGTHLALVTAHNQYEAIWIALGIAYALATRTQPAITLAISALTLQGSLGVMSTVGIAAFYTVPIMPLYATLIAGLLIRLQASPDLIHPLSFVSRWLMLAIILVPLLANPIASGLDQIASRQPITRPAPQPVDWLMARMQPDERIVAENYYYLWLYDYDFVSAAASINLPPVEIPDTDAELFAFWDTIEADYFLYDPTLPTSVPMQQLVDAGYMAARAYAPVATWGEIVIYAR